MPDLKPKDVANVFRNMERLAKEGAFPSKNFHDPRVAVQFYDKFVRNEPDLEVRGRNLTMFHSALDFSRKWEQLGITPLHEAWTSTLGKDGNVDVSKYGRVLRDAEQEMGERRWLSHLLTTWEGNTSPEDKKRSFTEYLQNHKLPLGNIGTAGFLGAASPIAALPGVTPMVAKVAGTTPERIQEMLHTDASRAIEQGGLPATIAHGVGSALPFVYGAGAVSSGARALGASLPIAGLVAGGVAGGATTPGGPQERALGAIVGGASLGLSAYARTVTAPYLASLSKGLYTTGVPLGAVRIVSARAAPIIANALVETTAFTTVSALQQEVTPGAPQLSIGELFASNFIAVLGASAWGLKFPSKQRRLDAAENLRAMKQTMRGSPSVDQPNVTHRRGPAGIEQAAALLRIANDPVNVFIAQHAALNGWGFTDAQARQIMKSGPNVIREMLTKPELQEVFKADYRQAQDSLPTPEAVAYEPNRSSTLDRTASVFKAKGELAAKKGAERAEKIRRNAKLDERVAEGKYQDSILEADAVRLGKTVGELRAEGRGAEVPIDIEATAKVIPGDRSKAGRHKSKERRRFARVESAHEQAKRLADRAEVRLDAQRKTERFEQLNYESEMLRADKRAVGLSEAEAAEQGRLGRTRHETVEDVPVKSDPEAASEIVAKARNRLADTKAKTVKRERQHDLANKRLERIEKEYRVAKNRLDREALLANEIAQGRTLAEMKAEGRADEVPEGFIEGVQMIRPDPKRARVLTERANRVMQAERARINQQLDMADKVHLAADFKRDSYRERSKQPIEDRDAALMQEARDAAIALLPKDSRGARILEIGSTTQTIALIEHLKKNQGAPFPSQPIGLPDFAQPGAINAMREAIAQLPLSLPGSANTLNLVPPDPNRIVQGQIPGLDNFRQVARMTARAFGPDLGNLTATHMTTAQYKSEHMHDLIRRKIDRAYTKWVHSLDKMSFDERSAAHRRIITLTEKSVKVGETVAETEFLTLLHRTFGDIKRVAKSQGRNVFENGYFPHIFETLSIGDTPAQRNAIMEMLVSGTSKSGPVIGSRFFKQRETMREDFVLDIPFVLDAYLHSTIRQIQGHSFMQFADNTLIPRIKQQTKEVILRAHANRIEQIRKVDLREGLGVADARAKAKGSDSSLSIFKNETSKAMERQAQALLLVDKLKGMVSGAKSEATLTSWADGYADMIVAKATGGKINPDKSVSTVLRALTTLQFGGALGGVRVAGQFLRNSLQALPTASEIGYTRWLQGMATMYTPRRGGKGLFNAGGLIDSGPRPNRGGGVIERYKAMFWEGRGSDIVFDLMGSLTGLELNPILRRSGVINNNRTREIRELMENDFAPSHMRFGSKGAAAYKTFISTITTLFTGAEILLRGGAFMGAYYKGKSMGMSELGAREYGKRIASRTQFDYSAMGGGTGFIGPFRSNLLQFGKYGAYSTDYYTSLITRSLQNDPRGVLPGEQRVMPLIRMAVGVYATSIGLDELGITLPGYALGGIEEAVKLPMHAAARSFGGALAESSGRPRLQGEMQGTHVSRALGVEPYEQTFSGALAAAFTGPSADQGLTLMDAIMGDPETSKRAKGQFARSSQILFPGSAIARWQRFEQEIEDNKILNPLTGDPVMDITDSDAWWRRHGINSKNVAEKYEMLRDSQYIAKATKALQMELNTEARNVFRELTKNGDPNAAREAYKVYRQGLHNIATYAGVSIWRTPKQINDDFRQYILGHVKEADGSNSLDRLRKKSPALRAWDRANK